MKSVEYFKVARCDYEREDLDLFVCYRNDSNGS